MAGAGWSCTTVPGTCKHPGTGCWKSRPHFCRKGLLAVLESLPRQSEGWPSIHVNPQALAMLQRREGQRLGASSEQESCSKSRRAHVHCQPLCTHQDQQQHKGILDQSNFCIKTGNCPSLRQNRGRAARPVSVSPRKGAGEGANGSLHLIQERVRKRTPQSICSRETFKSVPCTGLGKQKVRRSLLQQGSDQTGSDLS